MVRPSAEAVGVGGAMKILKKLLLGLVALVLGLVAVSFFMPKTYRV